jgi:hypothetical protein
MSWRCYRLHYRAESPIQIGWHKLGQIIRTRYYVPARNLWGAWVAAWAREYEGGWDKGKNPYSEADKSLGEWLRFTPLFAMDDDGEWLRPRYNPDLEELKYGSLRQPEFESKYVHGIASTAIAPSNLAADDGTLHEKEYLYARKLNLGMYVFVGHGGELDKLLAVIRRFSTGGGINYGYGRLRLLNDPPEEESSELFGAYRLEAGGECVVSGKANAAIASFVPEASGAPLQGEVELLSGREWAERGSGQSVRQPKAYWVPGSVMRTDYRFQINHQGYWCTPGAEAQECST